MSLIQVNKTKSFEELCPNWSKAIRDGTSAEQLHIMHPSQCIVGEAHGWSNNYNDNCSDCYRLSARFPSFFSWSCSSQSIFRVNNEIEFERVKQEFMNHWNEKHV
jgi:hypothetical protein